MGGFGNVLFQILAGNVIKSGNKRIYYVTNLTRKNIFTKILKWTIHKPLYENLISNNIGETNFLNLISSLVIANLSRLLKKKNSWATFYDENIQLNNHPSKNVFGYFQDKGFLKKNQNELILLCDKLNKIYPVKKRIPIVVHYRKGDSDWALKFSYYYDEVKEKLKSESGPITIVTDSYYDAKIFFETIDSVDILSSKNPLDDFKILLSAKKLYCAPSTFSWWAAHCLNHDSTIVMPNFFSDYLGIYVRSKKLLMI